MCGRYSLFDEREIADIDRIIREVEERFREKVKTGEIYPTDRAPILLGQDGHPEPAGWGYPHFSGKGVIINARAETAQEKRLFRDSLLARRCAVPSTGFTNGRKPEAGRNTGSACRIRRCSTWRGCTAISRGKGGS